MTVGDVTVLKPTSGQIQATFTVSLSNASDLPTTVNYTTSDITAKAGTDYLSNSGSITFAPGQTTQLVPVTVVGNASPTGNLTFGFNLTSALNASIARTQAIGTINDVNPAVGLYVANTVATVDGPGNTQAVFTVTLAPARLGQVVTVQYMTIDGDALANRDYLPSQGILTFEPGVSSLTVPVTVLGALTPQPTREFTLLLSYANPSGTAISLSEATATILNSIVVPTISINNVDVLRSSSGTTPATFTVSLSAPTQETISVNYMTSDGTAIAGIDYLPVYGTLTFLPGETSLPISVPVIGSSEYSPNKTFSVILSSPTAGKLDALQSRGTATILSQVPLPSINWLPVNAVEGVLLNNVALASLTTGTPSGAPVPPGTYFASINWGDGTGVSQGQLVSQAAPSATLVLGSHRYAESGTYTVRITLGNSSTPVVTTGSNPLIVAEAPIVLTGGLDPASDSGISHSDGITNVTQPVFDGTSEAFSTVSVYAQPTSGGARQLLGTTVTNASGAWGLQSTVALADGTYTVIAQAVDQSGGATAQTQLLPGGTTGPLIIDTVGPTVTSAVFARLEGSVFVTFQDNLSGLSMATVVSGANYSLNKLVHGQPGQFFPSNISLIASGGPTAPQQVRISFNGGRYIRGGQYLLTILSGGVTDVAGNALDGEFYGTFPSGNGTPGGNYYAGLDAIHNSVFAPKPITSVYTSPTGSGRRPPTRSRNPGKQPPTQSKSGKLLPVGSIHNGRQVVNHF